MSIFGITRKRLVQLTPSSNSTETLMTVNSIKNFILIWNLFRKLSCIRPDGRTDTLTDSRVYSLFWVHKNSKLYWERASLWCRILLQKITKDDNKIRHFVELSTRYKTVYSVFERYSSIIDLWEKYWKKQFFFVKKYAKVFPQYLN